MMLMLRSLLFNIGFYALTIFMSAVALPLLVLPRRGAVELLRLWSRLVVGMLRVLCGVRVELRGMENIPAGACVVAAKHQSAFDTVVWLMLLPDTAYVLKKELLSIPLYGWFCSKVGMIPVDRAGGGAALRSMLRAAQAALAAGRQVVIFPEGTRTAPGVRVPYLPGVVAIAGIGAPVIPVAPDSGRVWGRRTFLKRPGVIRISVLPALPQGLSRARLIQALEEAIETETNGLMAEAGPAPVENPVG
jgi:1-acyl-sn-glycerol-3-phosphate acyltransferase